MAEVVRNPDELAWIRYQDARGENESRSARDELILRYSPLVKYVAGRVASGLPRSVDSADLVSYGVFGLIDAIEKFQPERGYRFESYAMVRIRGSIVDGLRSLDWVPRILRSRAREIERAYQRHEASQHRAPTDAELAHEVGISVRQLTLTLTQIAQSGIVALDGAFTDENNERVAPAATLADRGAAPGDGLEAEEGREGLLLGIAALPERERHVLRLYYFENLNMADIGEVLGVSESRVCQIHARAVLHLRARLTAPVDD